MFPGIDRVYDNARARRELGWRPFYEFAKILELIETDGVVSRPLARAIGAKGYHAETFSEGPYPVEG
jgi:UDP-glucose 4-epimerase